MAKELHKGFGIGEHHLDNTGWRPAAAKHLGLSGRLWLRELSDNHSIDSAHEDLQAFKNGTGVRLRCHRHWHIDYDSFRRPIYSIMGQLVFVLLNGALQT